NSDVVVGTTAGIAVLHDGFWTWYGFDEKNGRFSRYIKEEDLRASSRVSALTEGTDGALWVGTDNGLIRVTGAYDGASRRWASSTDGLPSPSVAALSAFLDGVLVGTDRGLRRFAGNGAIPTQNQFNLPVRSIAVSSAADAPVLLGTERGLI